MRLTVISLNLRFGLASDGSHSWSQRKQAVGSFLADVRPDFMAFQEANDFQIDDLHQMLPAYHCIGKRSPAPSFWQNNVIFHQQQWICDLKDHFFLSPTPHVPSRYRKSRWPRQGTIGIFKKDGLKIACANTHFDFDPEVQIGGAKIVINRLSNLASSLPTIVMGDFNATPESACHLQFTDPQKIGSDCGPQFKNVFEAPYPATFHGFAGTHDGNCIDWILYRGELTLVSKYVMTEKISANWLSDHYPVVAVFNYIG